MKHLNHTKGDLIEPENLVTMTHESVTNELLGNVFVVQAWMRWYFLLEGAKGKKSRRGGFRMSRNPIHKAVQKYLSELQTSGKPARAYVIKGSLRTLFKNSKVKTTYGEFCQDVLRDEVGLSTDRADKGIKRTLPECLAH